MCFDKFMHLRSTTQSNIQNSYIILPPNSLFSCVVVSPADHRSSSGQYKFVLPFLEFHINAKICFIVICLILVEMIFLKFINIKSGVSRIHVPLFT